MDILVKDEVRKLKAYLAEVNRLPIKLDANENPYELPEEIINAIKKNVNYAMLNRYPDPRASILCSKLAKYVKNDIDGDMIITGDGSDELINIIVSTYINSGRGVLIPTPGFSMYNIYSSINCARVIEFNRDENFNIDMDEMISVIKTEKPYLVFICNPNNPTGTLTGREDIIKLLENCGCIVIVDEAYFEFSGFTIVDLVNKYDNLIVLRTLSKAWGLAGLRLGYLISNKAVISELLKVKSPFNVNSITQDAAAAVLDFEDYMKEKTSQILKERDRIISELKTIKNIRLFDTEANFIMIKVPDANLINNILIQSGIAIRNFNNYQGVSNCIRITVGKKDENDRLLNIIKSIVGD